MLEALVILAFIAGLALVAWRAYTHPRGAYWRSGAAVVVVALAGAALWEIASPAPEAGLGAFFIWCALIVLAIIAALVASAAATLRHLRDALR